MKLVVVDRGVLQIRWTWLPCWLALNSSTQQTIGRELVDRVLLGGVTTSERDIQAMSDWVCDRFQELFPSIQGLREYLSALEAVEPVEGLQLH